MAENTPSQAPVRRRRWLRRLLKGFLFFLLFIVLLLAGFDSVWRRVGAQHLAAAVDEANRQDANWRWDDLQAARPPVADEDNAALQTGKIAVLLPAPWPPKGSPLEDLAKLPPPVPLDPDDAEELREELDRLAPALAEAHALARFRTGRFPAAGAVESFAGKKDHLDGVRGAGRLLQYEAIHLAHDGKVSEAVVSARTALHAGRAVGDEPDAIALLTRLACLGSGVRGVERALAQGEASGAVLAETGQLLREEESTDWLTPALRGERARMFEVGGCLEAGDLSRLTVGKDDPALRGERARMFEVGGCLEAGDLSRLTVGKDDPADLRGESTASRVELWLKIPWFRENRAQSLEWATRAVENAALPVEEQPAAFKQLDREGKRRRTNFFDAVRWHLAYCDALRYQPMAKASHRMHAELRCASAALAAERYRLARGKWPESLDALVPDYLPAVPKDPYTGEAIRLRRLDDGLVIYSVGADGQDDGGKLQHLSKDEFGAADYGFRLWDVKHRRQAPPSARPNADDDP